MDGGDTGTGTGTGTGTDIDKGIGSGSALTFAPAADADADASVRVDDLSRGNPGVCAKGAASVDVDASAADGSSSIAGSEEEYTSSAEPDKSHVSLSSCRCSFNVDMNFSRLAAVDESSSASGALAVTAFGADTSAGGVTVGGDAEGSVPISF